MGARQPLPPAPSPKPRGGGVAKPLRIASSPRVPFLLSVGGPDAIPPPLLAKGWPRPGVRTVAGNGPARRVLVQGGEEDARQDGSASAGTPGLAPAADVRPGLGRRRRRLLLLGPPRQPAPGHRRAGRPG